MTQTIIKPTERQVAYLTDLTTKRQVVPGEDAATSLAKLTKWLAGPVSKADVSAAIDRNRVKPLRLQGVTMARPIPHKPQPAVPSTVLDSKYAIFTSVLENVPANWKVQEHLFIEIKEFRKKRVVRRLLGNVGGFTRNFMPADLVEEILAKLENPEFAFSASTLFGEVHQCCGTCGAALTDDVSLETKQGPICRGYWTKLKGGAA